MKNPFTVVTPEQMDAQTANLLFVDTDFPQFKNPGNYLILGPRGCGKSMMFRCLLPDVLKLECEFRDLEFLAFHVPIKSTQLNITELKHLDFHHASHIINEHFLTLNILLPILDSLINLSSDIIYNNDEFKDFYKNTYCRYLILCGREKLPKFKTSTKSFFEELYRNAEDMHSEFSQFILNMPKCSTDASLKYNLPFLSFLRFLVPMLKGLKKLLHFEKKNIYLFIDDADNLNETQTKILNHWFSCRTQPEISLKVSSQLGKYKTRVTVNGNLVESPHDYLQVNLADLYTTKKTIYYDRANKIIAKRLRTAGIDIPPEDYFQTYEKQEKAIRELEKKLIENWEKEGIGNRPYDDAQRYARPNYIRDLGGISKQRSSYMYAGFGMIIHLSSGIIRYVLEVCATMFEDTLKENGGTETVKKCIPYGVQNEVIRDKADRMLMDQFSSLEIDIIKMGNNIEVAKGLQNLIFAMGHTFFEILISERTERRVFSIALTNHPSKELKAVLDFGVEIGFLHASTIGNKKGDGRTWLYVLNRAISPHFNLDPTGFAGYLFVTNSTLEAAMRNGKKLRDFSDNNEDDDSYQPTLFDYID